MSSWGWSSEERISAPLWISNPFSVKKSTKPPVAILSSLRSWWSFLVRVQLNGFSPLPLPDKTASYTMASNYSIYTRLTHEANSPSLSTDCDITGCDVIFTSGAIVWPAVSGIDPPTPNMASSWLPSMFLAPLYHTKIKKKTWFFTLRNLRCLADVIKNNFYWMRFLWYPE